MINLHNLQDNLFTNSNSNKKKKKTFKQLMMMIVNELIGLPFLHPVNVLDEDELRRSWDRLLFFYFF